MRGRVSIGGGGEKGIEGLAKLAIPISERFDSIRFDFDDDSPRNRPFYEAALPSFSFNEGRIN